MDDRLSRWIADQIGPPTLLDSSVRRGATVVEVVTPAGERLFGKQVRFRSLWAAEVGAYRRWTPALGDRTPTLRAADESLQSMLVTAVPGGHPATGDRSAHLSAGRVLRRLHESRPARAPRRSLHERVSERLERLIARDPGLFTDEQVAFARRQVERMAALPARAEVPCHGDYRPHNWLVDETDTLRVIDFGEARWQVPAWDLTHLHLGCWWVSPDLARAFFEGYGRELAEDEREFVRLHLAVNAVALTWFGSHYGRPAREAVGRRRLRQLMAGHPTSV